MQNTQSGGSNELDDAIAALQGGVTSLDPSAGLKTIEGWQQHLQGMGLAEIAADLGELKQLLTSAPLDGRAIGAVLVRLGEKTSAQAQRAPADKQAKLQQLGSMLSGVGQTLT